MVWKTPPVLPLPCWSPPRARATHPRGPRWTWRESRGLWAELPAPACPLAFLHVAQWWAVRPLQSHTCTLAGCMRSRHVTLVTLVTPTLLPWIQAQG